MYIVNNQSEHAVDWTLPNLILGRYRLATYRLCGPLGTRIFAQLEVDVTSDGLLISRASLAVRWVSAALSQETKRRSRSMKFQ